MQPAMSGGRGTNPVSSASEPSDFSTPRTTPRCSVHTTAGFSRTASAYGHRAELVAGDRPVEVAPRRETECGKGAPDRVLLLGHRPPPDVGGELQAQLDARRLDLAQPRGRRGMARASERAIAHPCAVDPASAIARGVTRQRTRGRPTSPVRGLAVDHPAASQALQLRSHAVRDAGRAAGRSSLCRAAPPPPAAAR